MHMLKKKIPKWSGLFLLLLLFLVVSTVEAFPPEKLLGQETWLFTLPSTQDRAINYLKEYYGKYHLVMTFFPAAFTPL